MLKRRLHLPAGLGSAAFLRRYWQKRPLCVRGAFPGFRDPLTPGDLLRLAGRDDVESRLVMERGGGRRWEVTAGPLSARRLRALPARHWTLLVEGVDRHVPEAAALADHFAFIPRWRADDVMASLAAPRGTVGPHVDAYDVFLVQGVGRRRWQVARRFDPRRRPGLDLQVLRRFTPEQEWVLEPGDLLYVPPGVAHYGVALETALTYSVGFRAPSARDVAAAALRHAVHAADPAELYGDPDLRPAREPGRISGAALGRLRRMLAATLTSLDGDAFARAIGEMVTAGGEARPAPRTRSGGRDLLPRARAGVALVRGAATRAAFVRRPGKVLLFVDGWTLELPPALAGAAALLTGPRRVEGGALVALLRRAGGAALVSRLVSAGAYALSGRGRARGRP